MTICPHCAAEFAPRRADQVYCSPKCRLEHYKATVGDGVTVDDGDADADAVAVGDADHDADMWVSGSRTATRTDWI